jgi:hypothetical protein
MPAARAATVRGVRDVCGAARPGRGGGAGPARGCGARSPGDPRMGGQYHSARPAAYAVRRGARAGAGARPFG